MAANPEKIVMNANTLQPQYFLPQPAQCFFRGISRRYIFLLCQILTWFRQPCTINLSMAGQWELL
jgi:hypothetical protein